MISVFDFAGAKAQSMRGSASGEGRSDEGTMPPWIGSGWSQSERPQSAHLVSGSLFGDPLARMEQTGLFIGNKLDILSNISTISWRFVMDRSHGTICP
jgi:hypothetical protein